MLLFRSEEHVDRWCRARSIARGSVFSLAQCWELARAWYHDRLSPTWRRRTPPEVEAIFRALGFEDDFWRLT